MLARHRWVPFAPMFDSVFWLQQSFAPHFLIKTNILSTLNKLGHSQIISHKPRIRSTYWSLAISEWRISKPSLLYNQRKQVASVPNGRLRLLSTSGSDFHLASRHQADLDLHISSLIPHLRFPLIAPFINFVLQSISTLSTHTWWSNPDHERNGGSRSWHSCRSLFAIGSRCWFLVRLGGWWRFSDPISIIYTPITSIDPLPCSVSYNVP